jgi:hypothetical protein
MINEYNYINVEIKNDNRGLARAIHGRIGVYNNDDRVQNNEKGEENKSRKIGKVHLRSKKRG